MWRAGHVPSDCFLPSGPSPVPTGDILGGVRGELRIADPTVRLRILPQKRMPVQIAVVFVDRVGGTAHDNIETSRRIPPDPLAAGQRARNFIACRGSDSRICDARWSDSRPRRASSPHSSGPRSIPALGPQAAAQAVHCGTVRAKTPTTARIVAAASAIPGYGQFSWITQGRSDRDSSPCSRLPQSHG
jgi:hypothetical protein